MIKRIFDIFLSLILLLLFLPLFIFTSLLVYFFLGSPIFFIQKRTGHNEKEFNLIKYRSMRNKSTKLENDANRMTTVGIFIRKTSLDELPQLINVLKGEMSIVGPRPLLPEYLKLYSKRQKKRHHMKPGITGWAQINGRNSISWKEKLELDVWYVENYSFILDLKIIFRTLRKVLLLKDINQKGHVTTENFKGNDD